jgi:histidine triad (HIT) family protein
MTTRGGEQVTDCIFCMIASGTIPATVVWQDELVVAFADLNPQAPVHVLVVPREHYEGLGSDVPVDVLAALLGAVPRVAEVAGVAATGYRVIVNTGADAAQTVPHLHVHVLGGAAMSEGMVRLA